MLNLRNKILESDPAQLNLIISRLNQSERKYLVRSLNCEQTKKVDKIAKKILSKIEHLGSPPITKKTYRKSILAKIERKFENILEAIAYFLGYLTARKVQQLIRKSSLNPQKVQQKSISKASLLYLLEKGEMASPNQKISLEAILEKNGYGNVIRNCYFDNENIFTGVQLKGIVFQDCTFDTIKLSHLTFTNVEFRECNFSYVSFILSNLQNCSFSHCEIRETMFAQALIEKTDFSNSSVIGCNFETASIIKSTFVYSRLLASHFLQAAIKDSYILKSNLENAVFFGTLDQFHLDESSKESAVVTKPTTAIVVFAEDRGVTTPKAYMKLDQAAHLIPLRICDQSQEVDPSNLDLEIENALQKIKSADKKTPIPQKLLKELRENPSIYPESTKILVKTEIISREVNSFFLTGGADILPGLYGRDKVKKGMYDSNYRRAILELSLVHLSIEKGIPTMGLCRGSQIALVYCGAQLKQHVDGQNGWIQSFKLLKKAKSLYGSVLKNSIYSPVAHHQAILQKNGPTRYLTPAVINSRNMIMASEPEHPAAAPMVLLQFHPEYYNSDTADTLGRDIVDTATTLFISTKNDLFWKIFYDSAKAHNTKKTVLHSLRQMQKNA